MTPTLLLTALLSIAATPAAPTLQPAHQQVVDSWLQSHPDYRVAKESDCGECSEQIQALRRGMGGAWKAAPNYQPYSVVGDFNGDGQKDLAIVVIAPLTASKRFQILVFNGPFLGNQSHKPAFVSELLDLTGQGLFFGPPRPKPYRLLVGGFESEGMTLVPKGKGYAWHLSPND
jgi:hypothetical protein